MEKFQRSYILSIETREKNFVTIQLPFTMEFDIVQNAQGSAVNSSIRIFNLAENTRNKIRKNAADYTFLPQITLKAGYGINLPILFSGNVSQAHSVRQGSDFVTQIESFNGGEAYTNAITDEQFPTGTPQNTIIDTIVSSLPGVSKGVVGSYPGITSRGTSYNGSSTNILNEVTGGGFFINNGKAHCLKDNECFEAEIAVINSASGLLGTPILQQTYLQFEMLFEPRLRVGQKIQLQSITGANFNGNYKIVSLKHRGTISNAICGDAVTTVSMFAPQQLVVVE